MSENMQKIDIDKLLKKSLRDYENGRTSYVKKLIPLEGHTVSDWFYEEREETLDYLEDHGTCRRKSRRANPVTFRISFSVCASILIFVITSALINPNGITAAIPSFIMKSFSTVIDGTTIQLNPDVLVASSELNPYPKLEFSYIPDGYELQQAEGGESKEYNYYNFVEVNNACIRFFIMLPGEDYSISYGPDVEFDESKVVYVGNEEIYRMKKYAQGNKVLSYLWTRDGYALSVYSYKAEEDVVEKMIMKMKIK